MNVIHIGAGNIGKGFIFPVLQSSKQLETFTFLDADKKMVSYLQEHKSYKVKFLDKNSQSEVVYKDYLALEVDEILEEKNLSLLKNADLITISIGQQNLHYLVNFFEKINQIISKDCIIMCCENGNKVSSYFKTLLPEMKSNFAFVDCLVDRIIPIQDFLKNDELIVEKYYSWVCDQNQWPLTIPQISSLTYSLNIEFEIYKKMCMLNGVHCALAWYSYQQGEFNKIKTVSEALNDSTTLSFIKDYLIELAKIISLKYEVDELALINYGKIILQRFNNNFIDDQLARVGRNPISKLQKNERILSPILFAINHNLDCKNLLITFKNGLYYFNESEKDGIILKENIYNNGVQLTLSNLFHLTSKEIKKIIDNI